MTASPSRPAPPPSGRASDALLQRKLGTFSVATLTYGMVGSGWLFASYYAAQAAGPLSLVSWLIAGGATALVALVFIELGIARPLSGGPVRWPQLSGGPFLGALVGWTLLLQAAVGTPSEAAGLLQYGAQWWPQLYHGDSLTAAGLVVAIAVMAAFTGLGFLGVRTFATINNITTVVKFVVPALTIVLLIGSGFDHTNLTGHGGFTPYGFSAALPAIIGGGLIYCFGGINSAATMAGEVANPRRTLPRGIFLGFGTAFCVYFGLQLALLGAVPHGQLLHGWQGVNFHSPFAQLAMLLNLGWLSWMILADAVYSPAISLFAGITQQGRNTYGLATNHALPSTLAHVHRRSGIPRRAMLLNIVVGTIALLAFRNWHSLVSALGMFFAISYAVASVAVMVFRTADRETRAPVIPGMRIIAPISFVISALITYWSGWPEARMAIGLFALALPLYGVLLLLDRRHHSIAGLRAGLWFFVFMMFIGAMSYLGSFSGRDLVGAPWDSLIVAAGALVAYAVGLRVGVRWMTAHQADRDAPPAPAAAGAPGPIGTVTP